MTKDEIRECKQANRLYSLCQKGIWHIQGEEIDYGNSDIYTPDIGYFEGTYENAIDYALLHPDFILTVNNGETISHGNGGTITLVKVTTINQNILDEITALQQSIQNTTLIHSELVGRLKKYLPDRYI